METIAIEVRTLNEKKRSYNWPSSLCCRPLVGDYLQATNGQPSRVTKVTHSSRQGHNNNPLLLVEVE